MAQTPILSRISLPCLILLAVLSCPSTSQAGIIRTYAGNGTSGFSGDGGPATSAQLSVPYGVAVHPITGDLYIADTMNHRIRMVSPSGTITTVAGNGTPGYSGDGGPATSAQLNGPTSVAIGNDASLYIADRQNNVIRKVLGGTITTIAGNGNPAYTGEGVATAVSLNRPAGVGVTHSGTVIIADTGNHRIRSVNTKGSIHTIAGTGVAGYSGDHGPARLAQLNSPFGLHVVDAVELYIFVADTRNNRIRVITLRADFVDILTFAGDGGTGFGGDGGPAVMAQLNNPVGVWVDPFHESGTYIADSGNHRIRNVAPMGTISTFAGNGIRGYSGDGGPATAAQLNNPTGVSGNRDGLIFIADRVNNRIRVVTPGDVMPSPTPTPTPPATGGIITTIAGNGMQGFSGDGGPATEAALYNSRGVAVDSAGNVYIADDNNNRIRKVSGGIITTFAGNGIPGYSGDGGPATEARLYSLEGVGVDSAGNVYIADTDNNRIRRVSGGIITTFAGNGTFGFSGDGGPATEARLTSPRGVAADSAGNVYIADSENDRIRKVSGGIITTFAGTRGAGGWAGGFSGDGGPAIEAQLLGPGGVAVDSAGNVYIADSSNHRIRRVSGGIITTFAGNGIRGFSGDGGPATAAAVNYSSGVAVDSAGNVYIADLGNHRIRKVSGGIITTIAGNGIRGYSGDGGPATEARLNSPEGVAVDSAGNVYIGDLINNRIRMVTRP